MCLLFLSRNIEERNGPGQLALGAGAEGEGEGEAAAAGAGVGSGFAGGGGGTPPPPPPPPPAGSSHYQPVWDRYAPRGGSIVHLLANYGVFDHTGTLPITLMADAGGDDLEASRLRRWGCFRRGFLPLGDTPVFVRRLLGCLRIDCLSDETVPPAAAAAAEASFVQVISRAADQPAPAEKEGGRGGEGAADGGGGEIFIGRQASAADDHGGGGGGGGGHSAAGGLLRGPWEALSGGGADAVEGCALAKARAQLGSALEYYPTPVATEDSTLAWLSRVDADADAAAQPPPSEQQQQRGGGHHPGAGSALVAGPLVALEAMSASAHVSIQALLRRRAAAAAAWRGVRDELRAQRQREWALVTLRRWEQVAYRQAYAEVVERAHD
jgi:hypothetical protein